ncbi:MAG: cupredoxin domain-containing protein [Gammaproteobacteria bacterium]
MNKTSIATALLALAAALPAWAEDPVTLTVDADGVQRAAIVLDSYSYTPSHLIVSVGKPVELTLTKEGFAPHDFVIDDTASGLSIKQGVGGDPVKLKFTPTRTGTFAFYCSKKIPFGGTHRKKGMEGILEVR